MWGGLKIVHGKPRHSQSQGSVERANRDIEDILTTWLHQTQRPIGQMGSVLSKSGRIEPITKALSVRSPYEAIFGQPMKVGLKTSNLPNETINEIL